MGGLVARSAIAHAERHHQAWRERLQALVCLGTPHQGAIGSAPRVAQDWGGA
ncbi:GPI inositol-deacylase, partial [Rubrivivax gelatinosus]|uniref:GPI inositol-deacylase n=1 Tax=Rubrivivax gelatinosus TaxID=28068 RepID=UPI001ED96E33